MGYGLICTIWGYRLIKLTAPVSVTLLGFFITYTIADVASSMDWYWIVFIACGMLLCFSFSFSFFKLFLFLIFYFNKIAL